MEQKRKVGLVFLSGGQGLRFGGETLKQYCQLNKKPIALYAFDCFQTCPEVDEFVVVCEPEYQEVFAKQTSRELLFARPGRRRQDSVANGVKALSPDVTLVVVHDGVRPFPTLEMLRDVIDAADTVGAAATGVPVKFTLKGCDEEGFVTQTLDRAYFWEIQTPQAVQYDILKRGLLKAEVENLTVTDDTSLAELVGAKVKLVKGSYMNIKITTQEDLVIAEQLQAIGHVYV